MSNSVEHWGKSIENNSNMYLLTIYIVAKCGLIKGCNLLFNEVLLRFLQIYKYLVLEYNSVYSFLFVLVFM